MPDATTRRTRLVAIVLAAVLVLGAAAAGLSVLFTRDSSPAPAADGDVPASPRALAWVATQHLPEPVVGQSRTVQTGLFVELDYDPKGTTDATAVSVSVVPQRTELDCESLLAEDNIDGCEVRDGATVFWQEGEPEKEPGVLYVESVNDGASVVLFQQGPTVPADIDDFESEASLEDMIAAATDPRLGLTTTQEAVDAGGQLPWWAARSG